MHLLCHYQGIRAVLEVLGVLGRQWCRQSSSHRCRPSHLEQQQVTEVSVFCMVIVSCPISFLQNFIKNKVCFLYVVVSGNDYLSSTAHPSGPPLLGNHSLPALQGGQALPQRSFVLKKSPEVRGAPLDPGDQEPLNVPEDLAKTVPVRHCLLSDLSLLGSLGGQADHHQRHLTALVVLEVLLNLNKTRVQHLKHNPTVKASTDLFCAATY